MKYWLLVLTLLVSQTAYAGPFSDQLSRCLVQSTSEEDKERLIRWVYAAMSAHPKVQHLSNVSVADGAQVTKEAADLFVDLLAVRCRKEAKEAFEYDGEAAFQTSFQVLGRVAMQGIMSDENVSAFMGGLGEAMDDSKLKGLFE